MTVYSKCLCTFKWNKQLEMTWICNAHEKEQVNKIRNTLYYLEGKIIELPVFYKEIRLSKHNSKKDKVGRNVLNYVVRFFVSTLLVYNQWLKDSVSNEQDSS